jgi:hypothetical protein
MIDFNHDLWLERAEARYKKAAKRATSRPRREELRQRWLREIRCIHGLAEVIGWCNMKGIDVSFGRKVGAAYDATDKTVSMAGRMSPEKQLYMLLHECGHHLIGFDEGDERFGKGYPFVEDPKYNTTFQHRFACFEEEIEAWNRGWRLGKRLGLELPREDFDKVRLDCLRSYTRWINGRKLMITE